MKKTLTAIVTIVLLAASAAIAQVPQQAGPRPGALVSYLQLTPDQIATWQQINKDTAAAVKPLAQNAKDLQKQIRTALQASAPDPAAVGKLAVAAAAVRGQIRAIRDDAQAKRVAVLTPDQKVKFDAFATAMAFIRQHRPRPNA